MPVRLEHVVDCTLDVLGPLAERVGHVVDVFAKAQSLEAWHEEHLPVLAPAFRVAVSGVTDIGAEVASVAGVEGAMSGVIDIGVAVVGFVVAGAWTGGTSSVTTVCSLLAAHALISVSIGTASSLPPGFPGSST